MRLSFRIKHHFFSAFREFFVHHHGSLEFRAKLFALMIAVDQDATLQHFILTKQLAQEIYKDDEDRATLLMLTTKELVQKVKENNGLDVDKLIANIQKNLKIVPRYHKKIDTNLLKRFLELTTDKDTLSYQENIISFLDNLKEELV